jgi:hypothetical protein
MRMSETDPARDPHPRTVEDELLDRVKEVAQRIRERVRKAMGPDTGDVRASRPDDAPGEAPPAGP